MTTTSKPNNRLKVIALLDAWINESSRPLDKSFHNMPTLKQAAHVLCLMAAERPGCKAVAELDEHPVALVHSLAKQEVAMFMTFLCARNGLDVFDDDIQELIEELGDHTFGFLALLMTDRENITSCHVDALKRWSVMTVEELFKVGDEAHRWPYLEASEFSDEELDGFEEYHEDHPLSPV